MPSVTLLGATGLVGRHCLDLLASDRAFERVVVVARRKFAEATAPRVEAHIVDFDRLEERPDLFRTDQVICALGTTIKAVGGSKERFRDVDYGIPMTAARLAVKEGAHHFLLVSAIGADPHSRIFYSRVKGELEDALRKMPFRSVTIVRPSLLLGERVEFRIGEEIAKRIGWLVPGKYKPVPARDVAAALVKSAKEDVPGLHIIESAELTGSPFAGADYLSSP
jgi:uncharacterized protein YbjT (DUF2867 family)